MDDKLSLSESHSLPPQSTAPLAADSTVPTPSNFRQADGEEFVAPEIEIVEGSDEEEEEEEVDGPETTDEITETSETAM